MIICGRPSGHNFGRPLDRKQTFFKGGLTSHCVDFTGNGYHGGRVDVLGGGGGRGGSGTLGNIPICL